ncbi:hypothetical protein AB1Y20_011488 [Prymnesium parvum]|uniref:Polycystin cation channel PKD1/PKD2 domain-containing protein n=1 Tax=Prymnesium parvum TaxID=97485 RepID=A0AB34IG37_PRYPA
MSLVEIDEYEEAVSRLRQRKPAEHKSAIITVYACMDGQPYTKAADVLRLRIPTETSTWANVRAQAMTYWEVDDDEDVLLLNPHNSWFHPNAKCVASPSENVENLIVRLAPRPKGDVELLDKDSEDGEVVEEKVTINTNKKKERPPTLYGFWQGFFLLGVWFAVIYASAPIGPVSIQNTDMYNTFVNSAIIYDENALYGVQRREFTEIRTWEHVFQWLEGRFSYIMLSDYLLTNRLVGGIRVKVDRLPFWAYYYGNMSSPEATGEGAGFYGRKSSLWTGEKYERTDVFDPDRKLWEENFGDFNLSTTDFISPEYNTFVNSSINVSFDLGLADTLIFSMEDITLDWLDTAIGQPYKEQLNANGPWSVNIGELFYYLWDPYAATNYTNYLIEGLGASLRVFTDSDYTGNRWPNDAGTLLITNETLANKLQSIKQDWHHYVGDPWSPYLVTWVPSYGEDGTVSYLQSFPSPFGYVRYDRLSLDFVLFNNNNELYTHLTFTFESKGGYLEASANIVSFRLMSSYVIEIILLVMAAEKLVRELQAYWKIVKNNRTRHIKKWTKYFTSSIYNVIEILNIVCILVYVYCKWSIEKTHTYSTWYPPRVDSYVDFKEISRLNLLATVCMGVSFILTVLTLFKYLELMPISSEWYIIGASIEHGGKAARVMFLVTMLTLASIAIFMQQTFGTYMAEFQSFIPSLMSMMRITTLDGSLLQRARTINTHLNGVAMILPCIILGMLVLVLIPGMFLAILTDSNMVENEKRASLLEAYRRQKLEHKKQRLTREQTAKGKVFRDRFSLGAELMKRAMEAHTNELLSDDTKGNGGFSQLPYCKQLDSCSCEGAIFEKSIGSSGHVIGSEQWAKTFSQATPTSPRKRGST